MPGKIPTFLPSGGYQAKKAYEHQQQRLDDKRFYATTRWMRVRIMKMRLSPLCEPCTARGEVTPAQQVHHKLPRKDRPDLAFDLDNLESICVACHNAKGVR